MRIKRSHLLMAAGGLLLIGALGLTAFNWEEEQQAYLQADATVKVLEEQVIPLQPAALDGESTATEIQSVKIDDGDYIGILELPALELTLPVRRDWSYPALKQSPCRYAGSFLDDDMIIAGHNYKQHFGALSQLRVGDTVNFTDVEGFVYRYQVVELETLDGTAVEEMQAGDWDLTLFTCTYGGQSRVTVRCVRSE